jgi:hypothetical protein
MGKHLPIDKKPAQSGDRNHQRNKSLSAIADSDQRNAAEEGHDGQQEGEDLTTSLHRLPVANLTFRELHDSLSAVQDDVVVLAQQLRMGQGPSELDAHSLNDRRTV